MDNADDKTKMTRGRKVLCATMMLATLSGGAAHAASVTTTGSRAANSGSKLTVTDTKADGDNAYSNWNSSSSNRVATSGGLNSTNSVTVTLSNFRACRDQGSLNPDNCSSYVTP